MLNFEVIQQGEAVLAKATGLVAPATYLASCDVATLQDLRASIDACILKATQIVRDNVNDESMYFMFEWSSEESALTVVVTDESKTQDGPLVVKALFKCADAIQNTQSQTLVEDIHYWIKDYLTTSSEFCSVSLVAIFHTGERAESVLL